jgi:hypothetical protein
MIRAMDAAAVGLPRDGRAIGADGWSRTTTAGRPRGYSAPSSPVLSVRKTWRGWDSNPRSRAHEARGDSHSPTARRAGLAGWARTSDLRFPKPAGCRLPYSQRSQTRPRRRPGSRRPWNRTTLHRRIRAAPAQSACRRSDQLRRRQGIAPCSTDSQPAGSLLALRRSLAGRSRTPVPPRSSFTARSALDGDRTRLTRETARSRLQTRPRACGERSSAPSGIRTRVPGVRDRHPRPS